MNPQIVEAFAEMVRDKGIDRDILMSVIEETFSMMVKKKFGLESKFDIVMNMDKGDIEIYLEKSVVEVVEDLLGGFELGEAVDKAEHLDLEVGVLHGPVHQGVGVELGGEEAGLVGAGSGEHVGADGEDAGLVPLPPPNALSRGRGRWAVRRANR